MRFQIWLPAMQTLAMIWLMLWPLNPEAHKVVVRRADGGTMAIVAHGPTPDAVEWAKAINLPAVPVANPIEFAFRNQSLPSYRAEFYCCWVIGLLYWYMSGRFIDDVVLWRKTRVLERAPRGGVGFALLALPSTILMAAAFGLSGAESRVISAWAIVWLAITSAAFVFRVAQLIRHRRRPDFSRR